MLRSERFLDRAPTELVATLLDEGAYHGSTRTTYRILSENREVRAADLVLKLLEAWDKQELTRLHRRLQRS